MFCPLPDKSQARLRQAFRRQEWLGRPYELPLCQFL